LAKGVEPKRVAMLPNWVDTKEIFPLERLSSYRDKLGIDSSICVALYSGNMGEKQGLDVLLNVAKQLMHQKNLLFVMCGDGAARDRLNKQGLGLLNIKWLPLQPVEKLNELLNLADIHLLPQKEGVSDLVMPSKLLGMMASGRPILAMVEENTQLAQEVKMCGKVVHPGNIGEITKVLQELLEQPEERLRLGKLARIAARKWDKEQILSNLKSKLEEIVE
jgi:colanic acid biosynthesis glycosyl transferase WcaI